MKTKKERLREFSHRFFLSFSPDALHPVGGIPPPARVRLCRSQFAILQFAFAKGSLRVSWREDGNPSGPAGQLPLHKGAFFSCFSGIVLFQRENVCQIRRETSATGTRGDTPGPLLGAGPMALLGYGATPHEDFPHNLITSKAAARAMRFMTASTISSPSQP